MIASEATIQVIASTTADVAAFPTAAALFWQFMPRWHQVKATITPKTPALTTPVIISSNPIDPTVWFQY